MPSLATNSTQVMLMPPRQNYYRDDLLRHEMTGQVLDMERAVDGRVCAEDQAWSPLSGERASRVTEEVVAHLEHLYTDMDGHSPHDP